MNLFQVSLNIVSEDNNTKRRWAQDILFLVLVVAFMGQNGRIVPIMVSSLSFVCKSPVKEKKLHFTYKRCIRQLPLCFVPYRCRQLALKIYV